MTTTLDRPRYTEVHRHPDGARDKRGKKIECMTGDGEMATWVGMRRPAARIMVKPFAMCDECWKKGRL